MIGSFLIRRIIVGLLLGCVSVGAWAYDNEPNGWPTISDQFDWGMTPPEQDGVTFWRKHPLLEDQGYSLFMRTQRSPGTAAIPAKDDVARLIYRDGRLAGVAILIRGERKGTDLVLSIYKKQYGPPEISKKILSLGIENYAWKGEKTTIVIWYNREKKFGAVTFAPKWFYDEISTAKKSYKQVDWSKAPSHAVGGLWGDELEILCRTDETMAVPPHQENKGPAKDNQAKKPEGKAADQSGF